MVYRYFTVSLSILMSAAMVVCLTALGRPGAPTPEDWKKLKGEGR